MIEKMKLKVHKVLPLVYDDSLSYYEVLEKVVAIMNEAIDEVNGLDERVSDLETETSRLSDDVAELERLSTQHGISIYNMEDSIDSLESETGRLSDDVAELERISTNHDISINNIEDDIDNIEEAVDNLEGQMAGTADSGLKTLVEGLLPAYDASKAHEYLSVGNDGLSLGWTTGFVESFDISIHASENVEDFNVIALRCGRMVDIRCSGHIKSDASNGDFTINVNKNAPYVVGGGDPNLLPNAYLSSSGFLPATCTTTDEDKMEVFVEGGNANEYFTLSMCYITRRTSY